MSSSNPLLIVVHELRTTTKDINDQYDQSSLKSQACYATADHVMTVAPRLLLTCLLRTLTFAAFACSGYLLCLHLPTLSIVLLHSLCLSKMCLRRTSRKCRSPMWMCIDSINICLKKRKRWWSPPGWDLLFWPACGQAHHLSSCAMAAFFNVPPRRSLLMACLKSGPIKEDHNGAKAKVSHL